jgi:hypothetical protein
MRPSDGGDAGQSRWPLLPVVALFFACWLVCCWPWLSGAVTIPWDAKAHFQPQLQFLARSLHAGESPFWTPNVFSGQPQVADPQSLIFSPPFLLLALLNAAPSLRAADAATFGALFAGGVGVILFFRDRRWHWGGAVIAALVFSFGGSAAWRVQHIGQILSLAYLPIALWLLDRALARSSILYGALAGLAAGFLVLGRDQVSLLGAYVLAAWLLAHWLTSDARGRAVRASLPPLIAGAIVGAMVTLPPVTLTWLLAEQSNRPEIDFIGAGRGSLHPALLITTFIPHLFGAAYEMEKYWGPPSFAWRDTGLFIAQNMGVLYVGAAPILLFLTAGLTRGALWTREIRFFAIGLAVALLYALGWHTPAFRAFYEFLPGASLYRRPADATFLIGFFLAYCAGWLAHRLLTGAQPRRAAWQRAMEAALIIAPFAAAFVLGWRIDRMAMTPIPLAWAAMSIAAGLGALALAWKLTNAGRATLAALALVGVTTIDLAFNNGPNGASALPPSVYDVLRPDTQNETIARLKRETMMRDDRRDRIELTALGFHWPNAGLQSGAARPLYARHRRRRSCGARGPAQFFAARAILSLAALRHAGPALHRRRRPDRTDRQDAEARRLGAAGAHRRRLHLRKSERPAARPARDRGARRGFRAVAEGRTLAGRRSASHGAARRVADAAGRQGASRRLGAHRRLSQHADRDRGRYAGRRLARAQRSLHAVVVCDGRRRRDADPARQRPLPRRRAAAGRATCRVSIRSMARRLGAASGALEQPRDDALEQPFPQTASSLPAIRVAALSD